MKFTKKKKVDRYSIEITILLIMLLAFVFGYAYIEEWIYSVWPTEVGLVSHYSLPKLTLQFIIIAFISCLFASLVGISIGIFCFTKYGKPFRTIVEKISMIIQTIPTMAVLMIGIIAFGIGMKAAVIALVLQGILPIIFSTIAGIENISSSYIEVGKGLGMTKGQILRKIQLPMAIPVILSGMRTALIICIGAATLAFSTGAGGLGLLIQTGCSTYNTVFIFEGTVPICLLAILADKVLRKAENHFYKVSS